MIYDAIAAADEVWLEIANPLDAANDPGLLLEFAFLRDGSRLSDLIPEDEIAIIAESLVRDHGLFDTTDAALRTLDVMMPWVVSTMFGTSVVTSGEWDLGVDIEVEAVAGGLGIPVFGFETAAEQMAMFALEPLEYQVAALRYLAALLRHNVDIPAFYDWTFLELWDLWSTGQLEGIDLLTYGDLDLIADRYDAEIVAFLGIDEAEYDRVENEAEQFFPVALQEQAMAYGNRELAQRNIDWMTDIEGMLDRPGTFFIAVGAAHLVGAFGLPSLLESTGATVERVQ